MGSAAVSGPGVPSAYISRFDQRRAATVRLLPEESMALWNSNDDRPAEEGPMSETPADPSTEALIAEQREHWERTLDANPAMYGLEPSEAGRYAAGRFSGERLALVLELGAGQGRDTMELLRAGLNVRAVDFAGEALARIAAVADPELAERLTTMVHDVRQPLPFADESFDACYSHMLYAMALTTVELHALTGEVHRVLRPGGLCVYTVRHTGDTHYGAGRSLGDNLYENGGFVVHFFDRRLVERLAAGFHIDDITAFEEGGLPRRLWRVTMRRL
jgi:SAM-dependent methyltransferase